MVGDGVMDGVMDGVHVGSGVYVASVAVGEGVSVIGNKADEILFIEHACKKSTSSNTNSNLRISDLLKL